MRGAVEAALGFLDAAAPTTRVTDDDDEAMVCRLIERDQGLPAGSVELWEPHICFEFCRCHVGSERP